MNKRDQKISCVGSGVIGRSWAVAFSRAGYDVMLYDISAEALYQAKSAVEKSLTDMAEGGLVDDLEAAVSRISVTEDLKAALSQAFYVQESVPEITELKRDLYCRFDALHGQFRHDSRYGHQEHRHRNGRKTAHAK